MIVLLFGIIVLLLLGYGWLFVRVLLPLYRLAHQAEELAIGDFEAFQTTQGGIAAIEILRRAMSGMVGHVRRAQQQHRAYADRLTSGQEAERARIAHELHDETVQSLIVIAQSIELARTASSTEQMHTILGMARQQAVDTIDALRNLIADLRPPALDELGLVAALRMQADQHQPHQEMRVIVRVQGQERRLDAAHELTLFRAAQEALTNAARHGQAETATVTVDYQSVGVALKVQDNGRGFRVPDELSTLALQQHYGLIGLQERVSHLDGRLEISSKPGIGTTLTVFLPQAAPQPAQTVRDPVCSALIQPEAAYSSLVYNEQRYYFCCPVCEGAFQQEPELYLGQDQ